MQITPLATATFPLEAPRTAGKNWLSALPDALAFVLGLAVARWAGWNTGDLIWSLWLSSLVVGYSTIVWMIGQPAIAIGMIIWRSRTDALSGPRTVAVLLALILFVAALVLAFFTVHFGGFHYVHSQLLLHFFPIDLPGVANRGWAGKPVYAEIFRRYWIFLPAAFLSHRAAFMRKPFAIDGDRWRESIASGKGRDIFAEPYRNVLRMHALIFFFFFAHFIGLENFAVYSVIYVVYFFPWRLV
ncbi:MAG TPA: DUF6498-containing protein [Gemmatimonadaceae bacterium]